MLTHPRPRTVDGRIHLDFERLPVEIHGLSGTVAGTAHVAYDGRGAWWVEQVEVANPRHPAPLVFLAVSDPLFREISARLFRHRGEDVEDGISVAMVRVAARARSEAAEVACIGARHRHAGAVVARVERPGDRP